MTVDRREVFRYLRLGTDEPCAELAHRLDVVTTEVLSVARPASCHKLVPVQFREDGSYCVGVLELTSKSLRRSLAGCSYAFLFCATLGAGVDARLRRYAQTSSADLLIAQAVASALIESYCDECEKEMDAEAAIHGGILRPRFSPGYADLALQLQPDFLTYLDAQRRIGVVLTDSLLMVPTKSVTAFIGVAHRCEELK